MKLPSASKSQPVVVGVGDVQEIFVGIDRNVSRHRERTRFGQRVRLARIPIWRGNVSLSAS
jgi:hypothetical protein